MTQIPVAVPPELINHILQFVGFDDDKEGRESALKACTLTSRTFWQASRPHLFSEVTLTDNLGKNTEENIRARTKLTRFLELLEDDAARALQWRTESRDYVPFHEFIKKLIIQPSRPRDRDVLLKERRRFTRILSSLPLVLSALRQATIQTFIVSNPYEETSDWKTVHDMKAMHALEEFIVSQPIVHMHIHGIKGFPLRILSRCRCLKSLSMDGSQASWGSIRNSQTAGIIGVPMIKSLSFTKCHTDSLRQLLVYNFKNLPNGELFEPYYLSKLEITFEELRPKTVEAIELIPALSHLALRELCAHPVPGARTYYKNLDFGESFPSLRILEITYEYLDEVHNPGLRELLTWHMFQPQASPDMAPSSIKLLILDLNWTYCRWTGANNQFSPLSGWNGIDLTLSDSTRFPRLRAIELNLTFHYKSSDGVTEDTILVIQQYYSNLLNQQWLFPLLSQRGPRFQIDFNVGIVLIESPSAASDSSDASSVSDDDDSMSES